MEQNNNKKKIRAIKLHELKEVKNLNDYVLLHDNPNKKSFFQQIAYKSVVNKKKDKYIKSRKYRKYHISDENKKIFNEMIRKNKEEREKQERQKRINKEKNKKA